MALQSSQYRLLVDGISLLKDLYLRCGKAFSRCNLVYVRKFYFEFPKSETLSNVLAWSCYF
jgi:hypothetical protein